MSYPFKCPACGFRIFNRRLKRCEKCSAALPAEFQYTANELAKIEAERSENEASVRRMRERRDRACDTSWGGEAGAGFSLPDGCDGGGDGGGGD
jgi:hypothetical protein